MARKKVTNALKIRVWTERDGRKVLGPGRAEILGHIDRLKSISAAAREMDMSYRRAWSLIRDINEAAGETLVEVISGGVGGGGAHLTPRGQELLARYQKILKKLVKAAAEFDEFTLI